jgi:crotonobetainyl-CoA:carnitine CoA-transferase CaiB-like acyl-CoA transferase
VLDLSAAADIALARELAARADVLVESFRPGLMARWGLDHAAVAASNQGIVYCSISAFGSGQAGARLPGYDLLLQAMSGLMSVTGEPGATGRPLKVGAALIDMVCGLYAATAVLAALRARERDGHGQHVEVSLMDSALAGLLNQASGFLLAGVVPGRLGNRHPSIAPYETFAAADRDFAVACGNDALFARLCAAIGRAALADDPRYATNAQRLANRDALAAELTTAFAARRADDWVALLRAAGVPAGPINDVAQAFAFAQDLGLDPIVDVGGLRLVRSPMRLGRTPAGVRRPPPRLGEHDAELREWLSARPPRGPSDAPPARGS